MDADPAELDPAACPPWGGRRVRWRPHQSIVIASVAGRRGGVPSAGCCSVTGRFSPNRPCSPLGASRPSRYRRVTSRCQGESHTTT